MSEKRLSIIIPYYNTAYMLRRALTSIPMREDYEVIVVNDHSTENLAEYEEIQKEFSEKGVTFLMNRPNRKRPGTARNTGILHATGKYLMFLDADDYFAPGAFEIIDPYIDSEYDEVYFNLDSFIETTGEPSQRHKVYADIITNYCNDPSFKNEYDLRYRYSYVFPRLILREMVEKYHIRFEASVRADDIGFSMKAGHYAQNIKVVPEIVLMQSENEGSVTNKVPKEQIIWHDKIYGLYYKNIMKLAGRRKMKKAGYYSLKDEIIIRLRDIKIWLYELKNGKIVYKDEGV